MQDMTFEICNAIIKSDTEPVTTLINIRDNNKYIIAKLKDNKCWMIENLRISGDSVTKKRSFRNLNIK